MLELSRSDDFQCCLNLENHFHITLKLYAVNWQ
jgi:hypothetical protein